MSNINLDQVAEVPNNIGPSVTLNSLIDIVNKMPPQNFLYKGIKIPSMGAIFGVPKAGKTILAETLGFSVAAGLKEFLGEKLNAGNNRVLLFGLEEYFQSRTKRNEKQIEYFTKAYDLSPDWTNNIYVVGEDFPKHFQKEDDWELLDKEIERIKPTLVMIDSLTRLTQDAIEESTVASKLMLRLKEITHKHNIALILIHHTFKMEDRPITLSTLAGSRVVGQELDFLIGVNRSTDNVRYIKDVVYRYADDNDDQVLIFEINDHLVIEAKNKSNEFKLLQGSKSFGGENNSDTKLLQYFMDCTEGDCSVIIEAKDLVENLVTTKAMSKPTLYASLKRLIKDGEIWQPDSGKYALKTKS